MSPKNEDSEKNLVLIVEDEKNIQEILKLGLEMEGFQVITADNGKMGMDILSSTSPLPCVILLDLMMPIMNGWEFADAISKESSLSTIPLILVTAYGDRAKSIPSKAIVEKPVDFNVLIEAVNKCCGTQFS